MRHDASCLRDHQSCCVSGLLHLQVAMRYLTLLFAAAFALTGAAATSDPWCNGDPDCPEGEWCLEDKTCGIPPWKCGMLGLKCCNGKCAL